MRTFLLWRPRSPSRAQEPSQVGARLLRWFEPLFSPTPEVHQRSAGGTHLAWIALPVAGFRAPFVEEQGENWAFAPEYPINVRRLLRERGAFPADSRALLALARELERDPAPWIRELIPPSCLIWSHGPEVRVVNDGLGQAPLFEYSDEHVWALTNRVTALTALGVTLCPHGDAWATRLTTGWFVGDESGFRGVRHLEGGLRLRIGANGVDRERFDPLPDWLHPEERDRAACLERAHRALLDHLTDARELWDRPTVGLSGGRDSRAVASCLLALGADFDVRVRGQETHFDVLISAQLARMAGIPHRIKPGGGVPPDTAEACRAAIQRALRWQGGSFPLLKHKTFLARAGRATMDGGVVNVMGQHAGIGKADFAARIRAADHPAHLHEELLLDALMADAPRFLRPERLEPVRETLSRVFRKGLDQGLSGLGLLHFFFLEEYTRRWGSAAVASQTGIAVTPFLNPNFIRACYGYPEAELVRRPMHRYITARNRPDWATFPYTDQATEEDLLSGLIPPVEVAREEQPGVPVPRWRETRRFRRFHYRHYWKDVGRPLVKEALERGGFWSELFDPDQARASWPTFKAGADLLAVTYLLPDAVRG